VYVVSRPSPTRIGRTGHIDADLLAEELNGLAAATYYVSGPPSMVQAIRETLLSRGVDRNCIKTELFGGYD
jgi:NAD(P)H-flavin reductase